MKGEDKERIEKEDLDWIEDFSHENGNYINTCFECKRTFKGHKRRPLCKKCDPDTLVAW